MTTKTVRTRNRAISNLLSTSTCLAAIAGMMMCGDSARAATNVLVNPGFETGSISGWTGAGGACANPPGAFVESTNNTVNGSGTHVQVHSGTFAGKIFGDFCTASGSQPTIFQDIGTGAGSVWSADGFASTQVPDNIGGGNQFWLQVSFRDSGGNILSLFRSSVISTNSPTSTYMELQVTNQIDPTDLTTVIGSAASYTAPANTVKVRYEVVLAQTGFDGGSVYFDDLSLTKIAGSDPEITTPPASQSKVTGQKAVFSSVDAGATTLSFQWQKTDLSSNVTTLNNGGNISGATTGTLTVSNVASSDAGSYTLTVTDTNGSQNATAHLKVVPLSQVQTNLLINPGFEDGVYSESWESAWNPFNGNHLASTDEFYFLSATPVSAFDGTYTTQIFSMGNGSFNGIFQDVPALPGQVYTGSAWFLTPSVDEISGNNVCYLEVQFRDAGSNPLAQYVTSMVNSNFPVDTWINLVPTNHNAGDFTTSLGTSPFMVAPPRTASIRFQFTYHAVDAGGSVYVDTTDLRLREPVATATIVSNSVHITFPTVFGPTYNVLYRTNLTDTGWLTLTSVVGDGTVKIVTDSLGTRRFYVVNTQ